MTSGSGPLLPTSGGAASRQLIRGTPAVGKAARGPWRFRQRPGKKLLRCLARWATNIKAKFVASEKDNDKAPDYRIYAGITEFGAAWKKTARDSDREYLSVKLDDPSFPAPIYASLVKVDGDEGFTLIWSRRTGE
jgi:uncharacterized protein (DUF736 family)